MDSDKIVKLLEYISKRYDVMLSERSIFTSLYPADRVIFVQGNTLGERLEKFCKELMRYSGKQFNIILKEILNE